jgi:hypothetical protein
MNADDLEHECVVGYLYTDIEGAIRSVISLVAGQAHIPKVLAFGVLSGYQTLQIRPSIGPPVRSRVRRAERALRRGAISLR